MAMMIMTMPRIRSIEPMRLATRTSLLLPTLSTALAMLAALICSPCGLPHPAWMR